jgi:transcriptional regulator with XRE-family HTH domain
MTVPTPTHWQVMLREIRQDKGWSMRELAERAGMHERTIFEYENVRKPREMSIYKVERILASLGYESLGTSDLPAPARRLLFLIR